MRRLLAPLTVILPASLFAGVVPTSPTVVPEPSTMILMGAGVLGAVLFAQSRKTRK